MKSERKLLEDLIYSNYPRKIGKKLGYKAMSKLDIDSLEALKIAVENYKKYITRHKTEARFIKYFSSFMSVWEDWIEYPEEESHINPFSFFDEVKIQ